MSMRVQDTFSNCCAGIKDFFSATAAWIGKSVTTAGAYVMNGAKKAAEVAKPHLENMKTYAQQNKESVLIGAIAFTVGAIASALIYNVFCRGTNTPPPPATTTPAPTS